MPAGRPRKPTAQKQLDGTYRKDRDGGRADVAATGVPQKPNWLSAGASKFWDRWVPELTRLGIAKEIDGPELANACYWWDEAHRLQLALKKTKPTASNYLGLQAVTIAARKQWKDASAKFGFTPPDRARLKIEETKPSGVRRRDRNSDK